MLPPINKAKLLDPEEVMAKYTRLFCKSKITRFAVKLVQEAYFGKDVMAACTMKGSSKQYNAIPEEEMDQLKAYLYEPSGIKKEVNGR